MEHDERFVCSKLDLSGYVSMSALQQWAVDKGGISWIDIICLLGGERCVAVCFYRCLVVWSWPLFLEGSLRVWMGVVMLLLYCIKWHFHCHVEFIVMISLSFSILQCLNWDDGWNVTGHLMFLNPCVLLILNSKPELWSVYWWRREIT